MSKLSAVFTLFCFSIWILPLGAFIDPSKEKIACGGQRAICLCSHLTKKDQSSKNSQANLITSGAQSHKEEGSPSGSSHYYLNAFLEHNNISQMIALLEKDHNFYTCQFFRSIEHVPKA